MLGKIEVFRILHLCLCASLSLGAATSAYAGPKPGERPERPPGREGEVRTEMDNVTRTAEERGIVAALSLPRETVLKALAEVRSNAEESAKLKSLLREAGRRGPGPESKALSTYLQLLGNAVGEFHLKPSEFQNRLATWQPNTLAKFTAVLERASYIASQGTAVTREDAFNQALKERNLEDKYQQRCRRR